MQSAEGKNIARLFLLILNIEVHGRQERTGLWKQAAWNKLGYCIIYLACI